MTTRELENFLTHLLIDVGDWVVEALVLIALGSVVLYLVVGVPLIVLLDRHAKPRS
jgi:hypothetical protein